MKKIGPYCLLNVKAGAIYFKCRAVNVGSPLFSALSLIEILIFDTGISIILRKGTFLSLVI